MSLDVKGRLAIPARLREALVLASDGQLVLTAHEYSTDSTEWRACVDGWAPRLAEPEFAREAVQIVADIYNTWKVKFSPKPA